jgi:E3 ubiquitin-protein ligase synoviolin
MFISLLVGKVWGWIGEGRVEYLEQQPPANPRMFHARLALSLLLTTLFNAFMLRYCIDTVIHQAKPDMMVMFGFEFAILTILSTSTAARYCIALVEIYITRNQVKAKMEERRAEIRASRVEAIQAHARAGATSPPTDLPDENDVNELEIDVPGWEEKGRWVFYLDLLTDFVKLIVYICFFAILLTFYGLPIHILRDVVVTIRSFARRIMDFVRYRNATRDMNERYPDATHEEVTREEVCIICREDMVSILPPPDAPAEGDEQPAPAAQRAQRVPDRLRPKKLPCGHILHFACLRSWLERQQNCPTCRRPVVGAEAAARRNGNNGPGGAPGDQGPGQPGQGDGAPRARVYQFGPFRIGFGAVRGDLLHNLHQQIHQGNGQQPAVDANQPNGRQIGFGFGFGRRPAAPAQPAQQFQQFQQFQAPPNTAPSNFADVHTQLQQIEQRISEEVNSLRLATEQLHRVRHLQMELERLRLHQANPLLQPTRSVATSPLAGTFTSATGQRYAMTPGENAIGPGDPRLPEGFSLPTGWTLMPLNPAEWGNSNVAQGANDTPAASVASPANPSLNDTSSQAPATSENPVQAGSTETNSSASNAPTAPASNTTTPAAPLQTVFDWSTLAAPPAEPRTESPSQEWTDVQSEAGPSTVPAWGSNGQAKEPSAESDQLEDPSKGKARSPTVEEAEEEAS